MKNLGEYHDLLKATRYYLQIHLKAFTTNVLKCMNLIQLDFSQQQDWQRAYKKQNIELLTDIDIPLIVKKGIRSRICHAIHRYKKANNICMNEYTKDNESSYMMYLDANK